MRSVLFVCKANVCRSPTAEAVLRKLLTERGAAAAFDVQSAATHRFRPGTVADETAAAVAKSRGYDLSACRSRQIVPADFERFEMILTMDRANVADLHRIAPTRCKPKIERLLDYSDAYYGQDVPDPVGGNVREFATVLDMIEDGCRGLAQYLLRAA